MLAALSYKKAQRVLLVLLPLLLPPAGELPLQKLMQVLYPLGVHATYCRCCLLVLAAVLLPHAAHFILHAYFILQLLYCNCCTATAMLLLLHCPTACADCFTAYIVPALLITSILLSSTHNQLPAAVLCGYGFAAWKFLQLCCNCTFRLLAYYLPARQPPGSPQRPLHLPVLRKRCPPEDFHGQRI